MQHPVFDSNQYTTGHEVQLLTGGTAYFEVLVAVIDAARRLIHCQVYILDDDTAGGMVLSALKRAAARGVTVMLAVDSFGSQSLTPSRVLDLQKNGIQFRFFSPLPERYYLLRLGRRMHHKVLVVDGQVAVIGGINMADKYRGTATEPPWLDFAALVRGPVCTELTRWCDRIYREKYFGKMRVQAGVPAATPVGAVKCRVALNDWFRRKNQVRDGYRLAIRGSKTSVTIVASYFLPSRRLRQIVKSATKRGVQVRLLLPGKSDIPMAKRAIRYLYQWLLRHQVAVYEWDDAVLHGKIAVVDDTWVTIGSYNLNHLSQYSSIEMNLEVLDADFATHTSQMLDGLFARATRIVAEPQGRMSRLLDWGSYRLARWAMIGLYLLVRREYTLKG
jgi:cardiolipin synthase A/B